ncbi:ribbon-helix-helix protein, CopG family [Bosea caraganae]|uniref:Ribbon-helix-helix protein, CopG family n=1 Tax=Bosea caraganae TaxID=2763117 RepID=A0A370L5P9_9HYPH|nr:type II toxin-antitoxin system ParD family antitoxin [Bosea caraganae]RDJ23292.1 ribbon-helix-helix protein, CopG family [Bosea caraganae]RDJ24595.1 ribbon-helix-helix protein, CopG family [Bosea caraganae]
MGEAAEKLSITMTSEMVREIRASVESGEYASTSEALRDAVRLWQRDRAEHAERLATIRARIARSVADPRPGLTLDEARKRLSAHHERTVAAHAKGGS